MAAGAEESPQVRAGRSPPPPPPPRPLLQVGGGAAGAAGWLSRLSLRGFWGVLLHLERFLQGSLAYRVRSL